MEILKVDGRSMQRKQLITLHLVLSSFFLPFLLLMPLSGTLYLLGLKGEQKTQVAFAVDQPVPAGIEERAAFFRTEFEERGIDFDFEYIRESGSTLIFRPSSRDHYIARLTGSGAEVSLVQPDFVKRIVELHKGHGPTLVKRLQTAFGIGLILIAVTGVWLAAVAPPLRMTMGLSFSLGALLFVLALVV